MQPVARFLAGALILLSSYALLEFIYHRVVVDDDFYISDPRNWVQDAASRWDEVLAVKSHKTPAEAAGAGKVPQKGAVGGAAAAANARVAAAAAAGHAGAAAAVAADAAAKKRHSQQEPLWPAGPPAAPEQDSVWLKHSGKSCVSCNATETKSIVMARTRGGDDTAWVARDLPGWERYLYSVDDRRAALHTPHNKGKEANAYLWHLVTHYDSLTDVVVFLHAHEGGYPRAWHVDNEDFSNSLSVRRLRVESVVRKGFVNLRCMQGPGCPADIQPFRKGTPSPVELAIPHAMADMGLTLPGIGVPEVIAAPCCSQFAVSREMVQRRPRSDYERMYEWLMSTPLDDEVSGRVMEYMWHIMFGQMAIYCPDTFQCYCDTYGLWCEAAEDPGDDVPVD